MAIHTTDYMVYEATVIARTELSLLVEVEGEQVWVPKSQILHDSIIDENSGVGDSGVLSIPRWLARRLF